MMDYYTNELTWLRKEKARLEAKIIEVGDQQKRLKEEMAMEIRDQMRLQEQLKAAREIARDIEEKQKNLDEAEQELAVAKERAVPVLKELDAVNTRVAQASGECQALKANLDASSRLPDEVRQLGVRQKRALDHKLGYCKKIEFAEEFLREVGASPKQTAALAEYKRLASELEEMNCTPD